MKSSQINFVGNVIGQLTKVPQHQLTQEYVATLFADRLEARYKTNFNREDFLKATRVSPRMAEDAEEKRGKTAPLTSPREVLVVRDSGPGTAVPTHVSGSKKAAINPCTGRPWTAR